MRSEIDRTVQDINEARQMIASGLRYDNPYWLHFAEVSEGRLAAMVAGGCQPSIAVAVIEPVPLEDAMVAAVRVWASRLAIGGLVAVRSEAEIAAALSALSAINRRWYQALQLRLGGAGLNEIGDALRVSPKQASSLAVRAARTLRGLLQAGAAA